ncbi:MAG: 3-deoxy-7-phosphoheptulonate synthase [Candidatus Woesearchaeota archaeon]
MIIQMKHNTTDEDMQKTTARLNELAKETDSKIHYRTVYGEKLPVIAVKGSASEIARISKERLEQLEAVEKIIPVVDSYKLASKKYRKDTRIVKNNGLEIGNGRLYIAAGPCAVETEEQIIQAAKDAKEAGADMLRAGAYKPRTSPYSFQGHKEKGLRMLNLAKQETGLPIVTEITDQRNIDLYLIHGVDVFQVGARNCQNYDLLTALSDKLKGSDKAILYKRGPATSLEEFIQGAEYLLSGDVQNVMLCLRGIKGTDNKYTRNSIDTGDVAVLSSRCNLPIIYDPSHASGKRDLVYSTALGAIGHGAHGLMIEAHPNPEDALSDGPQSLYSKSDTKEGLARLVNDAREFYDMRRQISER